MVTGRPISSRPPDVEALVAFLPTAAGGRSGPARTGYRADHLVRDDYLTAGHQEYLDQEWIAPGEAASAHIWFLTPEVYPETMWKGKAISVQEGSRVVGLAIVTKVINPILARRE